MAVCIHSRSFCSVCWWLSSVSALHKEEDAAKSDLLFNKLLDGFSSARVMLFSCCKVTVRFPTKCFSHYFLLRFIRSSSQPINYRRRLLPNSVSQKKLLHSRKNSLESFFFPCFVSSKVFSTFLKAITKRKNQQFFPNKNSSQISQLGSINFPCKWPKEVYTKKAKLWKPSAKIGNTSSARIWRGNQEENFSLFFAPSETSSKLIHFSRRKIPLLVQFFSFY